MSNLLSLSYFYPELFLVIITLLIFIIDLIPITKEYTFHISIFGLFGTSCLLYLNQGYDLSLFMGMIVIDSYSHYFKWLFLISTTLIILVSRHTKELKDVHIGEYYGLIFILLLGLFLMSSSVNLLMIVLSIEIVSISSYILAGIMKYDKKSNESALKYVIFGAFASGIMIYGMSWLYGYSGSFDLHKIHNSLIGLEDTFIIYMAIVMILVGFGYKIAMVPFHYWSPDVYEGAPTTITAFFSVAPKAAGFALLIRVFTVVFTTSEGGVSGVEWTSIVAILSAVTMTVGNILALQQTNVKRMLAYSSIAHAGYMLMAVCITTGNAIIAVMFYLIIYIFMNLGAFFVAIYAANTVDAHTIDEFAGLGKRSPFIGAAMVIFLLSLTGVPPTAGFIGKVYLLAALIEVHQFYWLAMVAVINTVISLFYYFNLAKSMYFLDSKEESKISVHPVFMFAIFICALPTSLLIINWNALYKYIESSILPLIGG